MGIFCKLLGHKIPPGYNRHYGGKYFRISPYWIDGINCEHANLLTYCERCDVEFYVGKIHLQERQAERNLKVENKRLSDEIQTLKEKVPL